MNAFSVRTIIALTDVITGGASGTAEEPVGKYRSASELEGFFGKANLELDVGASSRVPAVRKLLTRTNHQPDGLQLLTTVIEQVVDPREYPRMPEKSQAVISYLNEALASDSYEVRFQGDSWRLVRTDTNTQVITALQQHTNQLDLEAVQRDFDRAIDQVQQDPEDAITAACSTLESVCKCILDELGQPHPKKMDIAGLMRAIQQQLNLSPGRSDLPTDIEQDVKKVLQGLSTATEGIGALRTHAGDAHGRGKRQASRVDSRIARLAIYAASTVSVFLIETWQNRAHASETPSHRSRIEHDR